MLLRVAQCYSSYLECCTMLLTMIDTHIYIYIYIFIVLKIQIITHLVNYLLFRHRNFFVLPITDAKDKFLSECFFCPLRFQKKEKSSVSSRWNWRRMLPLIERRRHCCKSLSAICCSDKPIERAATVPFKKTFSINREKYCNFQDTL